MGRGFREGQNDDRQNRSDLDWTYVALARHSRRHHLCRIAFYRKILVIVGELVRERVDEADDDDWMAPARRRFANEHSTLNKVQQGI